MTCRLGEDLLQQSEILQSSKIKLKIKKKIKMKINNLVRRLNISRRLQEDLLQPSEILQRSKNFPSNKGGGQEN